MEVRGVLRAAALLYVQLCGLHHLSCYNHRQSRAHRCCFVHFFAGPSSRRAFQLASSRSLGDTREFDLLGADA